MGAGEIRIGSTSKLRRAGLRLRGHYGPSTRWWYKPLGHARGMRSFPHFSNWLGITIAGIEGKQSEVVFNSPQNAVMSICFCNLSGLHHVSQENGIDSLRLLEIL